MISRKNKNIQTIVKKGEEINWSLIPEHRHLFHREIFTSTDADSMGVRVSSILLEKIEIGGAVLPHYHDVAEIIHITVGKVKLLCNGEWKSYQAGDTFLVPAGTVHSVVNDDNAPTEQISIFLPVSSDIPPNQFFKTFLVNLPLEERENQNV